MEIFLGAWRRVQKLGEVHFSPSNIKNSLKKVNFFKIHTHIPQYKIHRIPSTETVEQHVGAQGFYYRNSKYAKLGDYHETTIQKID